MVSRYQKRIPSPYSGQALARCWIASTSTSRLCPELRRGVPRVEYEKLSDERLGEPSAVIRGRADGAVEAVHRWGAGHTLSVVYRRRFTVRMVRREEGDAERVMTAGETGRTHTDRTPQAPPRRRGGWKTKLLILGGLIVLVAWASITWAISANRHKASTYGIADPSSAALRIENRTADFAITRFSVEEPEGGVAVQDVRGEIGPGAEAVLEITSGAYLVTVFYVEIGQAAPDRPQGFLSGSFSVVPGKAAIMHLQGGRSSPESFIFIPPELAIK